MKGSHLRAPLRTGFLLAILSFAPAAHASSEGYEFTPQVRGDLSARLKVQVSEPAKTAAGTITLIATVEGGQELEVEPARLEDPVDAWKATRESSWILKDGRATWSQQLSLQQLKSSAGVPALRVRFRAGPAAPWEEATWVDILKEPRPAPSPEPVAVETARPLWKVIMVAGVVTAVAGFAAGAWLRRRRPAQALSPEENASSELQAAAGAGSAPAELHQRLSEIVRRYLAERWQLPALQETTAEFLTAHGQQVPAEAQAALADFLPRCDLARFAPVELSDQDCRDAVALAWAILKSK